jgi:murein L,D-transpeptidase YcbB/YkuD
VLDSRGQVRHEPIDWGNLGSDEFNYQLVQAPGPFNPLGRVKFTFPNSFEVAIHDTPQKDLFSERVRDFSHGCIRAENAEALASFVLRDDPSWNRSRISAALDASKTKAVLLREPVPVYVLYWTVWVDEVGEVQFRADLYDIDRQLIEALSEARENAVSG